LAGSAFAGDARGEAETSGAEPSGSHAELQMGVAVLVLFGSFAVGLPVCFKLRRSRLAGEAFENEEAEDRHLSDAKIAEILQQDLFELPTEAGSSALASSSVRLTLDDASHAIAMDEGCLKLTCSAVQVNATRGARNLRDRAKASSLDARDLDFAETPEKRSILPCLETSPWPIRVGHGPPEEAGKKPEAGTKLSFMFATREDHFESSFEPAEHHEQDFKRDL